MLYYGNFESVSKKEALTLCSGLTEGDYVILDERVFRSDDCDEFTFDSSLNNFSHEAFPQLKQEGRKVKVLQNDERDCSMLVAVGGANLWISWGTIDFFVTKAVNQQKNAKNEEVEELEHTVNKLERKLHDAEEAIRQLKEVNDSLQKMLDIKDASLRGTIWTHGLEEECVVVQTGMDEFYLVSTDNYNRYYDESFTKEDGVNFLVSRDWILK